MPLEQALDLCWQTMAECFEAQELIMKQELIDTYYPKDQEQVAAHAETGT